MPYKRYGNSEIEILAAQISVPFGRRLAILGSAICKNRISVGFGASELLACVDWSIAPRRTPSIRCEASRVCRRLHREDGEDGELYNAENSSREG